MNEAPLAMLTPNDWELLGRHMTRVEYRRGAPLLREGAHRRALLIVRSGSVRVERLMQGRTIVLGELGAGEVLGDIGFVENAPASASVVAQDACSADVIEGDALQSLIAAEPGFAARFYHSLAISLARRTRASDVARMTEAVNAAAQVNRFHVPRTGNISAGQIPSGLNDALEAFEREMLAGKRALRAGAPPSSEAARVASACDAVVALLQTYTDDHALVDIGYSDLLAFRDPAALEAGVGDFVFRETFSTFMLSATMARCHAKPRGFPDDFETLAAIHRDQAEGDDWLGPLIDRWFLDRPLCRSRRAASQHLRAVLEQMCSAAPPGSDLRVASLASGSAAELFVFFERRPDADGIAMCVDVDDEALLTSARRAEAARLGDRMAFVLGNAVPGEGESFSLLPQHLVYALGLCEYLGDEQVVAMLDRCHSMLAPGGRVLVGNLATGNPDRHLMAHLLDWQAYHRSAEELRALFARSAFADRPLAVELDAEQVALTAACTKAV